VLATVGEWVVLCNSKLEAGRGSLFGWLIEQAWLWRNRILGEPRRRVCLPDFVMGERIEEDLVGKVRFVDDGKLANGFSR